MSATAIGMGGTLAAPSAGSIYQVLKEVYAGQKPKELFMKDFALLAMLSSNEKFGGRGWPVPFIASPAVNMGATFSIAGYNSAPGKVGEFLITTADIFGRAYLDAKTAAAARTDQQSFVNALTFNMNGAIEGCTKRLALSLYRRNYGVIGQISSIAAGVATLTSAADCLNFEVGQMCRASTLSTGLSLRGAATTSSTVGTANGNVIAVDRVNGTDTFADSTASLTTANTPGTVTTGSAVWAAADYLYNEGDAALSMYGLLDWFPTGTAALDGGSTFFGVTRSGYVRQRVAGTYYDGSKRPIIEALGNHLALIREQGGKPGHVFMSPVSLQGALNELAQKGIVVWDKANAKDIEASFEGIRLRFAGGSVLLVADPACPPANAFAVNLDSLVLGSIGPSISVFDLDGLPFMRVADSNQIELRVNSYSQIYTDKPVDHGVCALQY